MHILLTDILSCPRCGPEFGLIVLADEIGERRIAMGNLGCANCRQTFAIENGAADLRDPSSPPLSETEDAFGEDPDRVFRAAALLGVTQANATVLVLEPSGTAAVGMAGVLSEVHVIGGSRSRIRSGTDAGVLSPILTGERIPLRTGSVQGLALLGTRSETLLAEAKRVLAGGGRLVVDPAPGYVAEQVRHAGFTVQLEQENVVVAGAPEAG